MKCFKFYEINSAYNGLTSVAEPDGVHDRLPPQSDPVRVPWDGPG